MSIVTAVTVVSVLVVCAWCFLRWLIRQRWRRNLPRELRNAQLVYAERLFRAVGQVTLTARLDRAYRLQDGSITLLELKTRAVHRWYPSDVIELSAQAYAIAVETGERVNRNAFVEVQGLDGRTTFHRVELLSIDEVEALILRRKALLAGEARAQYACSIRLCQTCAYFDQCGGRPQSGWYPRRGPRVGARS
ncbi:PD-(D/E)XK nuclease family protein [Cupriavidus basilensis]|uniref:PD-(D/E)XK nuclease family protein n=1 Tax=Cupriavidus basilensis TaxID=68895 RepID=UPI003D345C31